MGKGRFPFRRTIEFLSSGSIILQRNIQVIALSFTSDKKSKGLRDFILRDLPRLQYKNENKQFVCFRDKYDFPHITFYYKDGSKQMIAVDEKRADDILNLVDLAGSAPHSEILAASEVQYPGRLNPANFGKYGHCYCMCEKPGQFPCPAKEKTPKDKTPKWWHLKEEKS